MENSDILVLPSLSEGLPAVGMQALAAGLAILGSDVGGISDVVQPGQNGFLIPVNDLAAFAERLTTDAGPRGLGRHEAGQPPIGRQF